MDYWKRSNKERKKHLADVRRRLERPMKGTGWGRVKVLLPKEEPDEGSEELTVVEVVGIVVIGLSAGWLLIALLTRYL